MHTSSIYDREVGPTGSGKTTTIDIILGLLPTKGTLEIDNTTINRKL